MSTLGFRFIQVVGETVTVTIDGEPHELPVEHSLLAGLLVKGASVDFYCAIGQCQRCRVRVNGEAQIACLYEPQNGDVIEIPVQRNSPLGTAQGCSG